MQCFCISSDVRNLLVMVLRLNESLKSGERIVSLNPLQIAQAQQQLPSLSTANTTLLTRC